MNLLDVAVGRRTVLAFALALGSALLVGAEPARPHARVVVTETETTILDVVEFAPNSSILRTRSLATLDAVAATLSGNPSIQLVEVQAHTAATGDPAAELELSQHRAEVVVGYLVDRGVAPGRLVAQGYGDTQPPSSPANRERIAFLILKRSGDQ